MQESEFISLGLSERVLDGLEYTSLRTPSPIQAQAIPQILSGTDLIACAQTGTGKTAAYLLPLITLIEQANKHKLTAIVVAPTRELAVQIQQESEAFSYFTSVRSVAIYGGGEGAEFTRQKNAISSGSQIAIATPGRLQGLMNIGSVDFESVEYFILDEADRMLDMGFYDDIIKIYNALPNLKQRLLFSATMPPRIEKLAKAILVNPSEIYIQRSKPAQGVVQAAFAVFENQKLSLIEYMMADNAYSSVVVFCSTKRGARDVAGLITNLGLKAGAIHSDLDQSEREKMLLGFRNREYPILVATDVISRGIDIDSIDMVINYDVPPDPEDYVHRVGRTARAASQGEAVTLVTPEEFRKFLKIEEFIDGQIRFAKLPAALGEGPVLDRENIKNYPKTTRGHKQNNEYQHKNKHASGNHHGKSNEKHFRNKKRD